MNDHPVLNLTAMATSMEAAALQDSRSIAADWVARAIERLAQDAGVSNKLEANSEGEVSGPLTLIFAIQLKLAPLIGAKIGVVCTKGGLGQWEFADMPNLNQQFSTVREIAVGAIETLDRDSMQRFGYRVTDVFKEIVVTGEDQHQANARVYAEKVGLHPAGQIPEREKEQHAAPSVPTAIELTEACAVLQADFARDGLDVDSNHLMKLLLNEVRILELQSQIATLPDGHVYCDLSLLYLAHAQWVRSISQVLAKPFPEDDESIAAAPSATQTLKKLKGLGYLRIQVMEAETAAKRGFGVLEPIFESVRTGESMEQARVRLHHQNLGLRPVK
ncbi:hypothetical protein QO021_28470 (plasmid) [Pseudomonas amygdali pv. lachrymans]|uniref:hypothetical protein n=1 Tax=Pseudomonas amygdali TaxID=47877 RepID=UPI000A62C51F|nr:hypothetical protein [Pseudomonas amygdali]RMM39228.1 hypothetical protein ALQ79_200049 [Pseudomonas amygdali pv. lachrymans]WIO61494.1 hypothetical protein QO021_28470 [Pseudomonas amygdali pv. lachrymans]